MRFDIYEITANWNASRLEGLQRQVVSKFKPEQPAQVTYPSVLKPAAISRQSHGPQAAKVRLEKPLRVLC